MTTSTPPLAPQLGDSVYLGSFLSQNHVYGVISDLDTPDMTSASWEIAGGNGLISVRALMGPRGPAGAPMFILKLQQQVFDDPDDLPMNLTTEDSDLGRYWIVREYDDIRNALSSKAYVLYGDSYEWFPMGSQGPPGPVPIITPTFELLDPDNTALQNEILVTGDDFHPSWHMRLKAPRGPTGPSATIASCPDVSYASGAPEIGDALVWNGTDWVPTAIGTIVPKFYT